MAAVLTASLTFVACDDDPVPSPQYFSFVSVNQDKAGENRTSFTTDDGKHLVPQNFSGPMKIKEGTRAIVYFRLQDEKDGELENIPIYVNQMDTCFTIGKTARVKDMDEAAKLGNNGMSLYLQPYYPQTTSKYFNFYVGINAKDIKKHSFTLAYLEDNQDSDGSATFMLCYDDANDLSALDTWFWVSIPVDEFSDIYKDKTKIKVIIKTRTQGLQEITMPVPGK